MKRLALLAGLLLALTTLCGCTAADPYEGVPNPIATITMDDGSVMTAELYLRIAPNTVSNFVTLANAGFYDGLLIHRIIPGVLIQTGDPTGLGSGGTSYTIRGEFSDNGFANDLSHTRGVISMCRLESDYNSASSQFFIMQGSYPGDYDGKYAAFGKLTDDASLAVLDELGSTPVDSSGKPLVEHRVATIRVATFGYEYTVKKIED